jgi:hypothetical protein
MDVLSTLSSSHTRIIELEFKGHFSHDGELVERGELVSTFEELVLDIECVSKLFNFCFKSQLKLT